MAFTRPGFGVPGFFSLPSPLPAQGMKENGTPYTSAYSGSSTPSSFGT